MRSTIIHDLPEFSLTSYGNGLAYEIERKPAGKTIFFQGDDAAQFRDEFDALTSKMPALDFADALGCIWNDYSEIAS